MTGVDDEVCVVKERGLRLRSLCDVCNGRPQRGQRSLARGELLCVEGQPADHVFPVISGFLKETVTLEDGRSQGIRFYTPGDVAGLEALVEPTYQATLEAITPARACTVARTVAEDTLGTDPTQSAMLCRILVKQVSELRQNVLRIGSMTAEERTTAVLRQLSRGTPAGSWFRLPMSRGELAELLGLSLGTVSRTVQQLARDGEIEVHGRMIRFTAPEARP